MEQFGPSQPYANGNGLTIPEVAKLLKASPTTIRRWIRRGRIQAKLTQGKYGPSYSITHIPDDMLPQSPSQTIQETLGLQAMLAEIERLNQEVGYWKGRYEDSANQIKLLSAPKIPWHKRLLQRLKF